MADTPLDTTQTSTPAGLNDNPTPAPESATQAQAPQTLEVSQEQEKSVTANQRPDIKNMTIEQLKEESKKFGGLTPDVQDELNKRTKENEGEIKNDKDLRAKKGKKDDEEFKPFKEQDILQYMYEQWLLGGMNAICNWGYNKVEHYAFRFSEGLCSGIGNVYGGMREEWNKKDNNQQPATTGTVTNAAAGTAANDTQTPDNCDAMMKCRHTNNEITQNFHNKEVKSIQESFQKDKDFLTRLKEGKTTEEDRKHPLYQTFAKLPPEKRNQQIDVFAKDLEKDYATISQTMMVAEYLVHLKHTDRALNQVNPQPMNRVAYRREVALMAMVIGHKLSQSKKPEEFLENLSGTLKKGQDHAFQNIQDGNYAVKDKKPKENPYLKDMYKQLEINENGQYSSAKVLEIIQKTPENAYEGALHRVASVSDAKSELINMKQNANFTNLTAHYDLAPPSSQRTTMPNELINQQSRQGILDNAREQSDMAQATISSLEAANDQRRSHAADRISLIKSWNQARGTKRIVETSKSAENAPQNPTFKIPTNLKGPDR